MSLFKKLFGANQNSDYRQNVDNPNTGIEIKTVTKFMGLDNEFIDLIYFPSQEKRTEFKAQLLNILKDLAVSNETMRTELMETFPNYLTDNNIEFPFIAELFIFKSYIIKLSLPEKNLIETLEGSPEVRGKEKLLNYYTALSLASHNLYVKNENGIIDISDEENIVLQSLSDEHKDFARAKILFQLGNSFMHQNNFDKMKLYYEKLISTDFDLSANTIADFIRSAGEDLYNVGDLKEAHKYLKKGLELNPKLGVKKLLTEIEKKIN